MDDVRTKEVTRLLKRGLNYYGLGDIDAAIRCWEQARSLDPENQAAHDYLETAYEEVDVKPGVASATAEVDDDPTPRSDDSLAIPGEETPKSMPAVPAEELDPDNPDTLIAGALDAYKQGRLDEAWTELRRVASEAPDRLDVKGYLQLVKGERAKQWAREIGDQGRVIQVKRTTQELMSMRLQPDEGFLLSQIDGSLTIADLISLSSSDRVRSLEIVARLLREGIVE